MTLVSQNQTSPFICSTNVVSARLYCSANTTETKLNKKNKTKPQQEPKLQQIKTIRNKTKDIHDKTKLKQNKKQTKNKQTKQKQNNK